MKLTIVCTAYKRPMSIQCLIYSLMDQSNMDFVLRIYHDGPDSAMEELLSNYADQYPDHIQVNFSERRHNDVGHSLREVGIREAETDFILITNDDNYYVPIAVETILHTFEKEDSDMVLFDMVHSHERPGGRRQTSYNYFKTKPSMNNVDIGAFAVKTELAKKVGWRDKGYAGDGTFCEDLVSSKKKFKISKVNKILFVHN